MKQVFIEKPKIVAEMANKFCSYMRENPGQPPVFVLSGTAYDKLLQIHPEYLDKVHLTGFSTAGDGYGTAFGVEYVISSNATDLVTAVAPGNTAFCWIRDTVKSETRNDRN